MQAINIFGELFRFNAGYLARELEKVADEKYYIRPEKRGNPLIWLLGHLVVNRGEIVEILGGNPGVGSLLDLFARGTKPTSNSSVYPKPQQLLARFMKLASMTESLLNSCDPNVLDQKSRGQFETVGQNLAFSYMHETHHIGQITYILNLPGIKEEKKTATNFRRPDMNSSTAKILLENLKSVFS